jgi:hypothetical protein
MPEMPEGDVAPQGTNEPLEPGELGLDIPEGTEPFVGDEE